MTRKIPWMHSLAAFRPKRMALCLAAAGMIWAACGYAESGKPAEVFRFGTAEINQRLTYQFLLPNSGTEPLQVETVTPSCDCITVLQWTTNVAAGATGRVDILFVPDKIGDVDYRVQVKTSSPEQPDLEYAIQGAVTAAPPLKTHRDMGLYLGTEETGKVLEDPSSVIWVDVRRADQYAQSRVPGSLQIPLYAVKTKEFLRGDRRVVLIDEGHGSLALDQECLKLRKMGFSGVSIWYGGLNAWQQLGGSLEGNGRPAGDRVPPAALHDIAQATDWLMVAADGKTADLPDGVESIPFDASDPDSFVSALNAEIQARPRVLSVLVGTESGEGYGAVSETVRDIDGFVFYLEGGWSAWAVHQQMMAAAQNSRLVVTESRTTGDGRVLSKPGGCGGCPK